MKFQFSKKIKNFIRTYKIVFFETKTISQYIFVIRYTSILNLQFFFAISIRNFFKKSLIERYFYICILVSFQ